MKEGFGLFIKRKTLQHLNLHNFAFWFRIVVSCDVIIDLLFIYSCHNLRISQECVLKENKRMLFGVLFMQYD